MSIPFRTLALALLLSGAACGPPAPEGDPVGSTATAAASAPASRQETPEPTPATPPDHAVAITADHRLMVLEVSTGETVRELDTGDDPEHFGGEGQEPFAGGRFLDSVDVDRAAGQVFYATCCEPAPGSLHAVALDGGAPRDVGVGYEPVVAPGGERLAVVEMQWITIMKPSGAVVRRIATGSEPPMSIGRLAWSPDGRTLALERFADSLARPRVQLIPADAADMDAARDVPGGDGWGDPAFDADGRLLVARQPRDDHGQTAGPAVQLLVDPATGEVLEEHELPAGVRAQVYDGSGAFLLTVLSDGTARWRGPGGSSGTLPGAFTAAAW